MNIKTALISTILISLSLALVSCSVLPEKAMPTDLPVFGTAPELTNQVWINVDHPLRLADLHGRVILLEMWTFG